MSTNIWLCTVNDTDKGNRMTLAESVVQDIGGSIRRE